MIRARDHEQVPGLRKQVGLDGLVWLYLEAATLYEQAKEPVIDGDLLVGPNGFFV